MKPLLVLLSAALISTADAQTIFSQVQPNIIGSVVRASSYMFSAPEQLVTVRVVGRTEAEARQNGFKLAIEYAVGQIVLSESEIKDKNVVRDEIIQYSSGYVTKYEVKERTMERGENILLMDVYVKSSKIADRLTASVNTKGRIEKSLSVKTQTYNNQATSGDKALKTVLNDYPYKALIVSFKDVYARPNDKRLADMVVPVNVTWNEDYLKGVGELLIVTGNDVPYRNRRSAYRIVSRLPGIFYSRTYDTWTEDFSRYTLFNVTFSTLGINVDVLDKAGRVVVSKCEEPTQQLAIFHDNQIILDGRGKLQHTVVFEDLNENTIEAMDKLVITAVKYCKTPTTVAWR